MRKTTTLTALATVSGLIVMLPASVSAATNEEIAGSILEAASEALGVDITDPDLVEELTDDLEYAIEEGLVDDDVVDEIEESIDSGTEPDDVDEQLEVNIIDQIANWEEYAPEVREAFELVRAEFEACRQSSASASSCARGLGFKMQVATANDALMRLQLLEQQLTDSGVVLTDEERAALEAERAELIAKIKRAEEKLARLSSTDPAIEKAKNDMASIRGRASEMGIDLDEEDAPGNSGSPQGNGAGNGNSGGNGTSGGNGGGNGNGNSGGGNGNSGGNGGGNSGGNGGGNSGGNGGGNGKGKGRS